MQLRAFTQEEGMKMNLLRFMKLKEKAGVWVKNLAVSSLLKFKKKKKKVTEQWLAPDQTDNIKQ